MDTGNAGCVAQRPKMMVTRNKKIVVAMSGGVDSSVAASLLVEQGYKVHGVSLRMWEESRGPRVCSDHRGAAEVAKFLGIPHTLLDFRTEFAAGVVKPFARDYLHGRTPNPCIACNRDFKLGVLLNWAREQGSDFVATGHYARIVHRDDVGAALWRGADRAKDQSYFLFALGREQLARALFPLGEMQKVEVRERARRLGLPAAERPESQDICFGDYKKLVASQAERDEICAGDMVDRYGKILGRHRGIHRVTIGQRHGLGIAAAKPLYVIEIDDESKRIVLGKKEELCCPGLIASEVNWLDLPGESEFTAEVQIRYRAAPALCSIRPGADRSCEVRFQEPVQGVTPGQAAVFYRGKQVIGGGWIERALKEERQQGASSSQ